MNESTETGSTNRNVMFPDSGSGQVKLILACRVWSPWISKTYPPWYRRPGLIYRTLRIKTLWVQGDLLHDMQSQEFFWTFFSSESVGSTTRISVWDNQGGSKPVHLSSRIPLIYPLSSTKPWDHLLTMTICPFCWDCIENIGIWSIFEHTYQLVAGCRWYLSKNSWKNRNLRLVDKSPTLPSR